MSDAPLITLQQALSICTDAERPLTASTFQTYVSRGVAPAPAQRSGRQPLWNADEVSAWAHAAINTSPQSPSTEPTPEHPAGYDFTLRPEHAVTLDSSLPLPQAVVKAQGELEQRLSVLDDMTIRLEDRRAASQVEPQTSQPPDTGLIIGLLRRFDDARTARQRREYGETLDARLATARSARGPRVATT